METDESDRLIFSMALHHPYRALEHADASAALKKGTLSNLGSLTTVKCSRQELRLNCRAPFYEGFRTDFAHNIAVLVAMFALGTVVRYLLYASYLANFAVFSSRTLSGRLMADRESGAAWRRRQRRLRSWWRHEQQTVAAVLATVTHHSNSKVDSASAALRGQKIGTSTSVGPAEYFDLSSDDGRPTAGSLAGNNITTPRDDDFPLCSQTAKYKEAPTAQRTCPAPQPSASRKPDPKNQHQAEPRKKKRPPGNPGHGW